MNKAELIARIEELLNSRTWLFGDDVAECVSLFRQLTGQQLIVSKRERRIEHYEFFLTNETFPTDKPFFTTEIEGDWIALRNTDNEAVQLALKELMKHYKE